MVEMGRNTMVSRAMYFICELSFCMVCETFSFALARSVFTREKWMLSRLSSRAR
jgi:hypothetical protein